MTLVWSVYPVLRSKIKVEVKGWIYSNFEFFFSMHLVALLGTIRLNETHDILCEIVSAFQ